MTQFMIAASIALFSFQPWIILRAQETSAVPAAGATTNPSVNAAVSSTAPPSQQDMDEILRTVGAMRQELKDSHLEIETLKNEVDELRKEIAEGTNGSSSTAALKTAVDQLRDDQEMTQSQVKTLEQSKVGTVSKYPLQISGMILINSFVVDGSVDNPILPSVALPRNDLYAHHSLGASISQTQLGLNATGPRLWNARTSADVSVDFFGAPNYTMIPPPNTMYLRLRTADVNLDWKNTQISAGLQTPLISLLSPTSFATVGQPALAWSGNLWTWLPQITIERLLPVTSSSHVVLGFGLIDPTTNDITGERNYGIMRKSLQPGYETRISYQWGDPQRPYEIGANGYYTRQLYTSDKTYQNQALDFWAGTADWRLPLGRIAELSGEFYRGRGIGDLGGGAFKNVVTANAGQYASGLDATGGWAQLKGRLTRDFEANVFFGEDSAQAAEVRGQAQVTGASPYTYLIRNQSAAVNLIYRPKTYLVFSGEYRTLSSWYTFGPAATAQTLGLTMGYIF
jgi:hypothetical protein